MRIPTPFEPRHNCAAYRASARYVLWACALSGVTAQVQAFTIERAESRYIDQQYEFEMVAMIDAPVERVEAVLRDYLHYSALDKRILESKVLERPQEGVAILATTVRACFGPFCRNVKRVERVQEAPQELTATADATRSDVKSGETRTQLTAAEHGTRVTYRTTIVPDFWIPAFVGRRLMLRTLEEATVNMFTNVEKIAIEPAAEGDEVAAEPPAATANPASEPPLLVKGSG